MSETILETFLDVRPLFDRWGLGASLFSRFLCFLDFLYNLVHINHSAMKDGGGGFKVIDFDAAIQLGNLR
ncbi:MAG TPA: hypothetical protein VFH31_17255, partial [Pyrinomonadaceae bacterium]|nr:hypothetical protein [Pyrinomonadaceae bacterium]